MEQESNNRERGEGVQIEDTAEFRPRPGKGKWSGVSGGELLDGKR